MNETEAVKETRRWRQQVYKETRNLTPAEQRAREEETIRQARAAGVEFKEVLSPPRKQPAR